MWVCGDWESSNLLINFVSGESSVHLNPAHGLASTVMSYKKRLFVFLINSVPFGLLFILLGRFFEFGFKVWYYIIFAVFYGLIAVFLRPKLISFLNKILK